MEKDFLQQDYIVEYIQFLESILQTASFGIWKWDAKKQELLLTKDLYEILNVEADTYRLNLENYRRIIHPEDLELVWENLQRTLRGQSQDYYDKYRIVNKNNQVLWIEVKGKVVRNKRGRAIFIFGVATNITEKVLSEQAYASQSILLQEAGKISKMGTWEIDVDTNSIFWTSETYKIFEVPETQPIDIDTFLEVFENVDQFIIKKKIDKSIFEGVPFDEECPIFVNNKRKWIRIIGIPQKERNRFIKIIGTVQDITQNKQIQQSLVESEERFQIFYDLASEGICIFNKDFKIIDTNPAFCLLFDLDASNLTNSNLGNYFTQDSFTVLKKYIESGDSFGEQIFLEGVRKDGKKIPFQCKFRTIYYNEDFMYIASFLDITFYHEAESLRRLNAEIVMQNELIEKQKQQLEETLENLKLTQEKLITSEKLASLGQLIAGIAHEINNPVGAISASNKNNQDILESLLANFPDILKKFIENENLVPLFLEFYSNYFHNMESPSTLEIRSKRKTLEHIFKIHSFENPLPVVDRLVDLGIYEYKERYIPIYKNIEVLDFLYHLLMLNRNNQIIQLAHTRTSKIIYALRNYSRVNQSVKKVSTDIHENIETVLTLYHNQLKNNVQVIKEYGDIPKINCYPDDLLQVWTNIIYNALQAMQFQGKLIIRTFTENDFVVVEIQDSGPGIPDHLKKKIFEPFFTTKPPGEGTGLGLDIVRRIIEKHSGKITLRSKPGETVFSFYLPT